MGKRPWRPVEARYVAEYCRTRWPHGMITLRVRLGAYTGAVARPELDAGQLGLLGNARRWVDAVVIDSDRVWIVEGKLKPDGGTVGQLALYLRLWPQTPEYALWATVKTTGLIVSPIDDALVRQLAAEQGIEYDLFRPDWLNEYWATVAGRQASPGRTP